MEPLFEASRILPILGPARLAQIVPAIILPITVDVIDFIDWIGPRRHLPYNSVGGISRSIQGHCPIRLTATAYLFGIGAFAREAGIPASKVVISLKVLDRPYSPHQ
jgi:hypothetical protein